MRLPTVLLALTLAVTGGAAGSWAGWHLAGPLPTEAEAAAVASTVAPGRTVLGVQRRESRFSQYDRFEEDTGLPFWWWGSQEYAPGTTRVLLHGGGDYAAASARIRDGLEADGWRFGPGGSPAGRDGVAVTLFPVFDGARADGAAPPDSDVALEFARTEPVAAMVLWALGAAGGLLLALRLGERAAARLSMIWGGVLLLPATVPALWTRFTPGPAVRAGWWPWMTAGIRPLALLGLTLLIIGALLAYRRKGSEV
jgi:hypothetical protein